MATIDDFKNIEMKIGTILKAEYIEGADKLLRLEVDFGTTQSVQEDGIISQVVDIRQILSGIREFYAPEDLIGKQCPFVTNLAPRMFRGLESNGMIVAAGMGKEAILLSPWKEVPPGTGLR